MESALACSSSSPTKPIGSEDFPNSLGSRWIYATYDSLTQVQDTVEVRVIEVTQVELWGESQPATRWRLTPALNDSIWYVIISGDTVRVLSGDEERVLGFRFMYLFPLEVGSRWDPEGACLDSTEVVVRKDVPIPDGAERTAYFLQSKGFCVNNSVKEENWFAPGVGILWMNWRVKWVGVSRNETWELISFEIASD
jgi:hypothetical protein